MKTTRRMIVMERVATVDSETARLKSVQTYGEIGADFAIRDMLDLNVLLLSDEARSRIRPGNVLNVTVEVEAYK